MPEAFWNAPGRKLTVTVPVCPVGKPLTVNRNVPGSPATGTGTGLTTSPAIGEPLSRTVNFWSEL